MHHRRVPRICAAQRAERNVDARGGNHRRGVRQKLVLLLRTLDEVRRKETRPRVRAGRLDVAVEEDERRRDGDAKFEGVEHVRLHLKDLLARIRAVSDVHEVPHLRRVDLLVLGGEEHRCHAHELQLLPLNDLLLEEAVDEIYRQVQRLWHELELQVDFCEPINENCAHLFIDVRLVDHVSVVPSFRKLHTGGGRRYLHVADAVYYEGRAWPRLYGTGHNTTLYKVQVTHHDVSPPVSLRCLMPRPNTMSEQIRWLEHHAPQHF